jgi:1-deoxy-D-xylulose-5-phosphate reductoisomerase
MVEFVDGSTMAQIAPPDMRGPIQYALTAGRRRSGGPAALMEWDRVTMTFEQPDAERYPALGLAREAIRRGGTAPAVLNAANEVAVEKFLARTIRFPEIIETVAAVLDRHAAMPATTLEAVLAADAWARRTAAERLRVAR